MGFETAALRENAETFANFMNSTRKQLSMLDEILITQERCSDQLEEINTYFSNKTDQLEVFTKNLDFKVSQAAPPVPQPHPQPRPSVPVFGQ